MASYLEIKQIIRDILDSEGCVDENSDLLITFYSYSGESRSLLISNESLLTAYHEMQACSKENLELSTEKYREVALQNLSFFPRRFSDKLQITDSINGLTYSVGYASTAYCMYLLDLIADIAKDAGKRSYADFRMRGRMALRHGYDRMNGEQTVNLLPELLKVYTLQIKSETSQSLKRLRNCASSFEFLYMYKTGASVSEYLDIRDMNSNGALFARGSRAAFDALPQRVYNAEVLDYYAMAMEARDPFTAYISFYHVIEHYYDASFRKKLTEEIRSKITHPDFSYKNETKLYDLVKFIKKNVNGDLESGKGNERDSLKYVLMRKKW